MTALGNILGRFFMFKTSLFLAWVFASFTVTEAFSKDSGKKWFDFSRMEIGAEALRGKWDRMRFLLGILEKGSGKMLNFAN